MLKAHSCVDKDDGRNCHDRAERDERVALPEKDDPEIDVEDQEEELRKDPDVHRVRRRQDKLPVLDHEGQDHEGEGAKLTELKEIDGDLVADAVHRPIAPHAGDDKGDKDDGDDADIDVIEEVKRHKCKVSLSLAQEPAENDKRGCRMYTAAQLK